MQVMNNIYVIKGTTLTVGKKHKVEEVIEKNS